MVLFLFSLADIPADRFRGRQAGVGVRNVLCFFNHVGRGIAHTSRFLADVEVHGLAGCQQAVVIGRMQTLKDMQAFGIAHQHLQ